MKLVKFKAGNIVYYIKPEVFETVIYKIGLDVLKENKLNEARYRFMLTLHSDVVIDISNNEVLKNRYRFEELIDMALIK